MKIEFLAHACFVLTAADGTRVVTDPYEAGAFGGAIGYDEVGVTADAVTVSHAHEDHACTEAVGGTPTVLDYPEREKIGSVSIHGVKTDHDQVGGADRGGSIAFIIEADGLRIAHMGDLGHPPTVEQIEEITPVDVLLLPVGGTFTVDAEEATAVADALRPNIVIPMHYKTPRLDLDIAPLSTFLDLQHVPVRHVGSSACEVTGETLPKASEVWVLELAR